MARKPRIKYTEELKAEIWRKYKQGESLWSIVRSIDRSSVSPFTGNWHLLAAFRQRSERDLAWP